MPSMRRLRGMQGIREVVLSFCMFGTPWRKNTRCLAYLVSVDCLTPFYCTGHTCKATGEKHLSLSGKRQTDQKFWTKIAEPYPRKLCELIAGAMIDESARARASTFLKLTATPG